MFLFFSKKLITIMNGYQLYKIRPNKNTPYKNNVLTL